MTGKSGPDSVWNIALKSVVMMTTKTTEMVWPRVKEERGGYRQEDDDYDCAGKEKRGGPRKDD